MDKLRARVKTQPKRVNAVTSLSFNEVEFECYFYGGSAREHREWVIMDLFFLLSRSFGFSVFCFWPFRDDEGGDRKKIVAIWTRAHHQINLLWNPVVRIFRVFIFLASSLGILLLCPSVLWAAYIFFVKEKERCCVIH